ncbi:uncharacterized protein EDB93DRAFT_1099530 [Suillus bovinus]|uniref:uncharacterized protein n=1 Tax=Suillus bovinus TaxID=48563 RepID=UPI001B87F493|nr:uncharacterized protein EDB93DRAFT_1099530 [Suillus bovinus]KAG2160169.1 hypothetical protein EDB93DRAFT_1099530 [Suillus bovinus]
MSARISTCEPRKCEEESFRKLLFGYLRRQGKFVKLGQHLSTKQKRGCATHYNVHYKNVSNDSEDDREEDGGDSDAIESDLELEPAKPQGLYRPNKLRRTYAMQDVTALFDDDELDSDGEQVEIANGDDSDAGREESDNEEPETMAMMLSDEVPSIVADKVKSDVRSCGKSQSARDQKHTAEIPTWRDVDNAVSESVDETSTTCGNSSEPYSSDLEGAPKPTSAARSAQNVASLIQTEKGNIKLLDQNHETRQVIRNVIIDAKCHIVFINAYPELVDKNQISLQSLLKVAQDLGIHAIKQCLQKDVQYASHLASLVELRIPLLCCDLKMAACANINSYFCLSQNIVKAKKLMEKHAYVYALRFDANDDASPIGKKPYQGDLLIFLLCDGVFIGAKSIGVKFTECFIEISRNKANRPEIPISILALVATAVYAFWKTLGSPGKFNFTGNQFSETYIFHIKFLKNLKKDAPGKFHCMMADIYEAVQVLKRKGNDHMVSEHQDALALLDLDGMAED